MLERAGPIAVAADDPAPPVVALVGDFSDWYRSQYTSVVRLAFLLVDSAEIAEEVAQDAFAAVFERFHSLDNPDAYLRRCVVSAGREVQRKRHIARRHPPVDGIWAGLGADHVIEVVRRLPYRQRAVVVLRFYAGMSQAEISETLAVPLGTVKSTTWRALGRLRRELGE